jgi:hypothetical protein
VFVAHKFSTIDAALVAVRCERRFGHGHHWQG